MGLFDASKTCTARQGPQLELVWFMLSPEARAISRMVPGLDEGSGSFRISVNLATQNRAPVWSWASNELNTVSSSPFWSTLRIRPWTRAEFPSVRVSGWLAPSANSANWTLLVTASTSHPAGSTTKARKVAGMEVQKESMLPGRLLMKCSLFGFGLGKVKLGLFPAGGLMQGGWTFTTKRRVVLPQRESWTVRVAR